MIKLINATILIINLWDYKLIIFIHILFIIFLLSFLIVKNKIINIITLYYFILIFWGTVFYLYVLKTIKIYNKNNEFLLLKKINDIICFIKTNNFCQNNLKSKILKNYFKESFLYFFFRIIWRGKAYRVRFFKKNNKFTFNFGYSHWLKLIYDKNFYFCKVKRQNYIIIFYIRNHINYVKNFFNNLRTLNKYTKRGIKIKKSPYIKRFGKISQVNSSLHSFG